MKMVDGSTVRHGRVDCSHPERASVCRVQSHGSAGGVGITREKRVMQTDKKERREKADTAGECKERGERHGGDWSG